MSPLPRRAAGGDPTSRRQVPLLDADGSAPGGRLLSESCLSRPSFLTGRLHVAVLVGDLRPLTRPLQPWPGAHFLQRGNPL